MISSRKTDNTIRSVGYPKLMIQKKYGYVVFFSEHQRGTVVHEGEQTDVELGFYSRHWGMTGFGDFNGRVTLENKL